MKMPDPSRHGGQATRPPPKLLNPFGKLRADPVGMTETYCLINSLAGGGAERQVSLLSHLLPFEKIILLEDEVDFEMNGEKIETLTQHTRKTSAIWKMLYLPIYCWKLKKSIKKPGRDIASSLPGLPTILSFLERANFVNIVSKLFFKHRAIVSVRIFPSMAYGKGLKRLEKLLIRWLYGFADLVVTNSQAIRDDLIEHFGLDRKKIQVIHNGIDLDEVLKKSKEPLEEKFQNIFDAPVIMSIGRLKPQKGQDHLIRVFQKLKAAFPSLKLVIMGEGELRTSLVKLGKELSLKVFDEEESLELKAWQDRGLADLLFLSFRKNPFPLLRKATIFALPSIYEGFPNVLLEAMALGIPTISNDCPSGPKEISGGILVPVGDENAWLSSLTGLFSQPTELSNLALKGKNRVQDFSIQMVAESWKKILSPESISPEEERIYRVLKTYEANQCAIGHHSLLGTNTLDELISIQEPHAERLMEYLKQFEPHLSNKKPLHILDIGCSLGVYLFGLQKYADELVGVDLEESSIACAKELAQYKGFRHISFFLEDGITLKKIREKFPHHFDLITIKQVAEHVFDMEHFESMLKNAREVLAPHGVIFLEMPNYLFPFESHCKIPIPPHAKKSTIRWIARLFGRIKNENDERVLESLNIISTRRAEKVFRKLQMNFRNLMEEKKLRDIFFGSEKLSARYRFLTLFIRISQWLFINHFLYWLLTKTDFYPSASYFVKPQHNLAEGKDSGSDLFDSRKQKTLRRADQQDPKTVIGKEKVSRDIPGEKSASF